MNEIYNISKENDVEVEEEDTSSISSIEKPFDPKKIDIITKPFTIDLIIKRLNNDEIDLYTSFQRGMDLWDVTKQSRLIESILIRLPLPAFYFDGSNDSKWLVVDGLQRLCSFKNYIIKKSLKLQNLEYLTQFNNIGFDSLPRDLRRRIEEHAITVYIINPGTPEEVKFNIFKRINTGGLILTPQEIRHALNQGIPSEFIQELAELIEFTKLGINPKRMQDRDFVTRFVAFYINKLEEYKPDLDTFLNSSMSKLKKFTSQELEQIKADFLKALVAACNLFGIYAFRKRYGIEESRTRPINKALFEVWTVALSKLTKEKIKNLIESKDTINQEFIHLLNSDTEFVNAITMGTGDKKRVEKRFKTIEELVKKVLK